MTDIPLIVWKIAQIAERDGVTRTAVSKQARKIVELRSDTPVELDARGRITGISIAHYDEHRERFVNPAKAAAVIRPAEKSGSAAPAGDSFEEARRQSEWIKVRREHIRFQEDVGLLVRADTVREATRRCGAEIKAVIMRLPNHADDLAAAVSKEGVSGVRRALKTISFDLGNQVADRLAELAASAPETDPLIETTATNETKERDDD